MIWSPDSTTVAFETNDGTLRIEEVTSQPGVTDGVDVVACDHDCTRQFAFQPAYRSF